jgi:hypothetical protein
MLLGKTHEQAMKQVENELGSYFFIASQDLKPTIGTPKTNHPNSKQRYFSISTEDVTEYSNTGNPIIKGQINGFKNLKSDINYYVYVFDKNEKLNYADITKKGKLINKETFSKDDTGTFSFEYPDLFFTETPEEYQFVVGFTYGGVTYYGPTKTMKTKGLTSCPDNNHPHLIDLGLLSGTKWACCNVGAHFPEEYGGYYAWGETSEKAVYNWNTYVHCDGSFYTCHNLGSDISGTGYDVAHVQWGGSWCMPTLDEMRALANNCSSVRTTENGVYGRRFTGPNGNSIFLPATGYRQDGDLKGAGSVGYYWSSALNVVDLAYDLYLGYRAECYDYEVRCRGQSVRPVVRN